MELQITNAPRSISNTNQLKTILLHQIKILYRVHFLFFTERMEDTVQCFMHATGSNKRPTDARN